MPVIESSAIAMGILNQVLGSLWKWLCELFSDFRRSKRVATLEAEIATLTGQIAAANAEVTRLKAVEAEQLILSNRQKKLILAQKKKIRALQADLAERDDFERQTAGYEFTTTEGGAYVPAKDIVAKNGRETLYLCPVCYNHREASALQPRPKVQGQMVCPACKNKFPIGPAQRGFIEIF